MRMAADSHGPEPCETALIWLVDSASVGGAWSAGDNRNNSVTGEDGPVTSIVSNIIFQRSMSGDIVSSKQAFKYFP